jgi:spore coat polysaccharide biosynthesis predicted glycosyltransferase SpsG
LTEEILLGLNKIKDLPYNKIYIVVNEQSSISISSLLLETDLDYEMHISPDGLGEIYSKIDLCIGSSGISALERCYFGIPSLLIIKAKNQEDLGKNLHDHKLATSIKLKTDLDLVKELEVFLKNYETNKQISNNCHNFISSNGSREIAAEIKKLLLI